MFLNMLNKGSLHSFKGIHGTKIWKSPRQTKAAKMPNAGSKKKLVSDCLTYHKSNISSRQISQRCTYSAVTRGVESLLHSIQSHE